MGKIPIVFNSFSGGWSIDDKVGSSNSFPYSRHLDFRKSQSSLTILPATASETGIVVTGLVTEMIQLPSGLIVAIDSSGGVYQRDTSGVWTKEASTLSNTAFGMVYNFQQDTIYIPGTTNMHSITNADGRFGGVFTVNDNAFTANLDQSSTTGGYTYSTPTGVLETDIDKLSLTPTIEPLYSVKLYFEAVGTGDVTLTMHDAANNVLATKTIAGASLVSGYNEFVFTTPVRMLVKPNAATYHFHINYNIAGTASTIATSASNNFSTAKFESYGNRLVATTNGFHPVAEFLQYYIIGNGNSIVAWEPISQSSPLSTEWVRNRVVFPTGYEVTSMALWNEYLAIACERRSTSATSEFQDGKIFLWDGTSTTYNRIINVPEGSPYSLFSQKSILYYFAGGSWYQWSGGEPQKFFQMPNTDTEYSSSTYLVNYPKTITVRNGILLGAFPSETNSTAIEHAVYSFGQRNQNVPNSFGYSYSISTGTRTYDGVNALRLGMIKSFGDKLFISWRDDSQAQTFGVDKIDPSSAPFTAATWSSLIIDSAYNSRGSTPRPDKDKMARYLRIDFASLPSGATITPKYKINREASWNTGTAVSTAGKTSVIFQINKRYREIQVGMDLTATTTTPTIIAVTLMVESLTDEKDL